TATNRIADAGSLRAVVMPRMADRSCSKQSNATVLYGRERQDHDVPAVWEASAPGASRLMRGQLGSQDRVGSRARMVRLKRDALALVFCSRLVAVPIVVAERLIKLACLRFLGHQSPAGATRARAAWSIAGWTILLLLGFARPSLAEPVRLRLSFQLPLSGTLGAILVRFKEAVERDTGDAITIEILHGANALPDRTVANSVMAGELEMAVA